jgi:DNA-binding MarR family transcriptional regulator
MHEMIESRLVYIGTGGVVYDRGHAAEIAQRRFPNAPADEPTVTIIDLSGALPTPAALKELVVPLGQQIRGGQLGQMRLVVSTPDDAMADFIGYLAHDYKLSLFVAPSAERLSEARAVGDLTLTQGRTLDQVLLMGGTSGITAADFARRISLEPAAANNRLATLARDGYLFRISRSRSDGDLFLDPRSAVTIAEVSG